LRRRGDEEKDRDHHSGYRVMSFSGILFSYWEEKEGEEKKKLASRRRSRNMNKRTRGGTI